MCYSQMVGKTVNLALSGAGEEEKLEGLKQ